MKFVKKRKIKLVKRELSEELLKRRRICSTLGIINRLKNLGRNAENEKKSLFSTLYLCICVFVYFTFDTRECHIRYP